MILSTTKTIARLPHLATFLADSPEAVAGWGRKRSGQRAFWLSKALRRPLALLEDGFIRSVERSDPTLSLLVDDVGVYYDATRPSRMERSIAHGVDAEQAVRAQALMRRWQDHRISKYNHAPEFRDPIPGAYVLVVDQIVGDLSIAGGLASPKSFSRMLAAAMAEHPKMAVVVKMHPDVFTKRKTGFFSSAFQGDPRVYVVGVDCHPANLIEAASAIYTVTSLMGFEALLWGKPVRCFGMPFYAGWGVTIDDLKSSPRRHAATLEDVAHAALVDVARYADPASGVPWQVEQTIEHVALRRNTLVGNRSGNNSVSGSHD